MKQEFSDEVRGSNCLGELERCDRPRKCSGVGGCWKFKLSPALVSGQSIKHIKQIIAPAFGRYFGGIAHVEPLHIHTTVVHLSANASPACDCDSSLCRGEGHLKGLLRRCYSQSTVCLFVALSVRTIHHSRHLSLQHKVARNIERWIHRTCTTH